MSQKEKKLLYLAYGSNINLQQMRYRCPTAKRVDAAMLHGYELEFRGVATIVPKADAAVPVLAWELQPQDEKNLDRYEGFPHLYRKQMFEIEVGGKTYDAMAYVMTKMEIAPPSRAYYEGILAGYLANGMDTSYLNAAVERSVQQSVYRSDIHASQDYDDEAELDESDESELYDGCEDEDEDFDFGQSAE